jgi:hypothetical protein
MRKEVVVGYFKVQSYDLLGEAEGNEEKLLSR